MSRPPLDVGTYGTIRALEVSPGQWRARAKYRDHDGVTRRVERFATSKGGAERRLREAIRDRLHRDGDEDITPDTTVAALAQVWITEYPTTTKISAQSLEKYQRTIDKIITPGVGGLRVRELTVGKADRFLGAIPSDANAKWARIILTGMLALAARRDAIPTNPMRDTSKRISDAREVRAMTVEEVEQLRANVAAWSGANTMGPPRGDDLQELLEVLVGTGVRIGEALALRWQDINLDADMPTLLVSGTVVLVQGKTFRQDHTKTASGRRMLALPDFVFDALQRQRERDLPADDGLVFPSARGGVRSPNNVRRQLRQARGEALEWVTPHALRKTTATVVAEVNGTDAAADQLGHSDGRPAARFYIDSRHRVIDNRNALDRLAPHSGWLKGAPRVKSAAA